MIDDVAGNDDAKLFAFNIEDDFRAIRELATAITQLADNVQDEHSHAAIARVAIVIEGLATSLEEQRRRAAGQRC
jgi:hypothetical protein